MTLKSYLLGPAKPAVLKLEVAGRQMPLIGNVVC
jgi:hypothetical protein